MKKSVLLLFVVVSMISACGGAANAQPENGDTITSEKGGVTLVYVSAREFEMGSGDKYRNERPVHSVYLSAYYIGLYEVTNAKYAICVEAGDCEKPGGSYYSNPDYDDHPVNHVSWDAAQIYCEWIGGSLPTEAQWEKAARGTDGRSYPWGEGIDPSLANYGFASSDITTAVGSYPQGVSPYGLYDMGGNVWEWVADWYADDYYQYSPQENPAGPESGEFRVVRGGSWVNFKDAVRAARRNFYSPDVMRSNGFRCAASP